MLKQNTQPQILQGGVCKTTKEQALKKWFVELWYEGKQYRLSKGLNRIKTYIEKLQAFEKLQSEVQQQIDNGTFLKWVEKPTTKQPTIVGSQSVLKEPTVTYNSKPVYIPLLKDAVKEFIQWHKDKGSRLKTVQSYRSKLNYLINELGNVNVNEVYQKMIVDVLIKLQTDNTWSNKTYNSARGIYYGLFEFCVDCRYLISNPLLRTKSKYVGKSTRNKAFTDKDFHIILAEVEKDEMLSMFVKSIYYTCIRPQELSNLQIKHIEWDKQRIYIPASISKNKKDGYVHINDEYCRLLKQYYYGVNEDYYLFCNDTVLYGTIPYHPNRPYKRFVKILEKLNLQKKGYTLYSTKHYSNIKKYQAGFTVAEIMVCNRHHSLSETENYLRDLIDFIDVSSKSIPSI